MRGGGEIGDESVLVCHVRVMRGGGEIGDESVFCEAWTLSIRLGRQSPHAEG